MNIVHLKAIIAIYEGSFEFQCSVDSALLQAGAKPNWQPVVAGLPELEQRGFIQVILDQDARGTTGSYRITAKGSALVHLILDF